MPLIGCHISMAGGAAKAVSRAVEREAEALQIFTTSPRAWAHQTHDADNLTAFRGGILGKPVVVHGSYLMNFATTDLGLLKKSSAMLADTARWTAALGARTVILHPGQAVGADGSTGVERVAAGLKAVLKDWPAGVTLALEQSAGQKGSVGARLEDLRGVLDALDGDPRVAVWLDTAHAFGAGWDLRDAAGVDRFAGDIARAVGWDRIAGIHANDSKVGLGSKKDRHENIGLGLIGDAGFKALLGHPSFSRLPFILETPGLEGEGPDLPNMRRLKGLRGDRSAAL